MNKFGFYLCSVFPVFVSDFTKLKVRLVFLTCALSLLRRKAAPDKVIPTACGHDCAKKQHKHDVAAQPWTMKR